MKDYKDYDKYFICECDYEFLRVEKFKDEPQIYFSKYRTDISELSLWERIKLSISFIFKPEKYDIHGGIILSIENAIRLANSLKIMTKEKTNELRSKNTKSKRKNTRK